MSTNEHVLITDGDGYVGRFVARKYLRETTAQVSLLVRATELDQLLRRSFAAFERDPGFRRRGIARPRYASQ
jgi:thioester reductase-like protein